MVWADCAARDRGAGKRDDAILRESELSHV